MNLKPIIEFSVGRNVVDAVLPKSDSSMDLPRALVNAGLTMKLAKEVEKQSKKL